MALSIAAQVLHEAIWTLQVASALTNAAAAAAAQAAVGMARPAASCLSDPFASCCFLEPSGVSVPCPGLMGPRSRTTSTALATRPERAFVSISLCWRLA
jgi:hypothetical protein